MTVLTDQYCAGSGLWTDYPRVGASTCELRKVEVVSYDGNKHYTVREDDGTLADIKAGYLYERREDVPLYQEIVAYVDAYMEDLRRNLPPIEVPE